MSFSADQITIAITVFDRRQYIRQAIASALAQAAGVRILVVEDCGPDLTLQDFVNAEFGDKIEYVRNPVRRGLFGNWNECLKLCRTEWITILHDDDYLAPCFVETMVALSQQARDSVLYFGRVISVDEHGSALPTQDDRVVTGEWTRRSLNDIVFAPFLFPGHLFSVAVAQKAGGFRETSLYAGDWEMWGRLMALGSAAQSSKIVAFSREHKGLERGTNQVIGRGKSYGAALVQHKRILSMMPAVRHLDRRELFARSPLPLKFLLRYGYTLTPRLLKYHIGLLILSRPLNLRYRIFQTCARIGGALFVRTASKFWRRLKGFSQFESPKQHRTEVPNVLPEPTF